MCQSINYSKAQRVLYQMDSIVQDSYSQNASNQQTSLTKKLNNNNNNIVHSLL